MKISISKEQLGKLPAASYTGTIVVVDDLEGADRAVSDLKTRGIIGFDTETRPAFRKGQLHNVALLQLFGHEVCYLFRLNKIGLPDSLKSFLEDPDITKVGLSTHDDFHNLRRQYDLHPEGFIELQNYVGRFGISDLSLTKINAILFGERLSKSQRLSNWEADTLTPPQQMYAALDAVACVRIYEYLAAGLFDAHASQYAIPESSLHEAISQDSVGE